MSHVHVPHGCDRATNSLDIVPEFFTVSRLRTTLRTLELSNNNIDEVRGVWGGDRLREQAPGATHPLPPTGC